MSRGAAEDQLNSYLKAQKVSYTSDCIERSAIKTLRELARTFVLSYGGWVCSDVPEWVLGYCIYCCVLCFARLRIAALCGLTFCPPSSCDKYTFQRT